MWNKQEKAKKKKTHSSLSKDMCLFFFSWNVAPWRWSCLVTRQVAASIQAPRLFDGCLQLTVRELSFKCTLILRSKWRVSRSAHRVDLTFLRGAFFFFFYPFSKPHHGQSDGNEIYCASSCEWLRRRNSIWLPRGPAEIRVADKDPLMLLASGDWSDAHGDEPTEMDWKFPPSRAVWDR